jgi:hypothetical protein
MTVRKFPFARRRLFFGLATSLLLLSAAGAAASAAEPALLLELHGADLYMTCGFSCGGSTTSVFSSTRVQTDTGVFGVQSMTQEGGPKLDPLFAMSRRDGVLTESVRDGLVRALGAAHIASQRSCQIRTVLAEHLLSNEWILTWHGVFHTHTFLITTERPPSLPACPPEVVSLVRAIRAARLVGGV